MYLMGFQGHSGCLWAASESKVGATAERRIVARSAPTTRAPIQTGTVAAATNPASSDSAGKPEIETAAIVSPSFNQK